jgi:protein-L-isoaspartate(D-aspartate) O-methyltransferase
VLAALAARVIAIELIPELAEQARSNLEAARRGAWRGALWAGHPSGRPSGLPGGHPGANIRVICGDGSLGFPAEAPYDAISVAAGAPKVPPALLEQLSDPGRLVIPVGDLDEQQLRVIAKSGGELTTHVSAACRFVPLRGGAGWR